MSLSRALPLAVPLDGTGSSFLCLACIFISLFGLHLHPAANRRGFGSDGLRKLPGNSCSILNPTRHRVRIAATFAVRWFEPPMKRREMGHLARLHQLKGGSETNPTSPTEGDEQL